MLLRKSLLCLLLVCLSTSSYAELHLELTRGRRSAIPIAIIPNNEADNGQVFSIVQQDLANSGRFRVLPAGEIQQFPKTASSVNVAYWRNKKIDDVVVGQVTRNGAGDYQVKVALVNTYAAAGKQDGNQVLLKKIFAAPRSGLRRLAHRISDAIFLKLTGVRGIFSTKIAYVEVIRNGQHPKYLLQVADADGYNPKAILSSGEPIMSPAWSPNGREIAYVSFEKGRPQIYISNVRTGRRRLISSFSGINGAPAFSPNGRQLALVLSKSGAPKIYTLNLATKGLTQVTHGRSIDTEPSWSPDGKSLIFTSDRGGAPQIYQINLASRQVQRVTYDGNYNARASYTNNGQEMVMLHRDNQGYNIALLAMNSGMLSLLTHSGFNESPSLAPNGMMVIYATASGKKNVLAEVSTDGAVSLRLPAPEGSVQEPAWSPFLS